MEDAQYEQMCPAIAPIWGFSGVVTATVLSSKNAVEKDLSPRLVSLLSIAANSSSYRRCELLLSSPPAGYWVVSSIPCRHPFAAVVVYPLKSNLTTAFTRRPPPPADAGAAYGTAKSGIGIMSAGVQGPELIWKNLIPIIM